MRLTVVGAHRHASGARDASRCGLQGATCSDDLPVRFRSPVASPNLDSAAGVSALCLDVPDADAVLGLEMRGVPAGGSRHIMSSQQGHGAGCLPGVRAA